MRRRLNGLVVFSFLLAFAVILLYLTVLGGQGVAANKYITADHTGNPNSFSSTSLLHDFGIIPLTTTWEIVTNSTVIYSLIIFFLIEI